MPRLSVRSLLRGHLVAEEKKKTRLSLASEVASPRSGGPKSNPPVSNPLQHPPRGGGGGAGKRGGEERRGWKGVIQAHFLTSARSVPARRSIWSSRPHPGRAASSGRKRGAGLPHLGLALLLLLIIKVGASSV